MSSEKSGAAMATWTGEATAPNAMRAFEPADGREAIEMARLLVASRLLPRAVSTPEAAFAIIVTGRELGLSAMQSLRAIHVIDGKPTLSADLMLALVKRSAECSYFRLVESTAEVARYETKRRNEPEPTAMAFTIDEAKNAGLIVKDNWKKYPAAMLRARCIAALARAVYPDLMMSVYDPDELSAAPAPESRLATVRRVDPVHGIASPPAQVVADEDGVIVEPAPAQHPRVDASDLHARIAAASSKDELTDVGKDIRRHISRLADADRQPLREAYEARKKALTAAAKPAPAPEDPNVSDANEDA